MTQTVKREVLEGTVIVTLQIQSLEAANVQQMSRCVAQAMQGAESIVVDLGLLQYFDVRGFAAILQWARGGTSNAEVRLCSQSGAVRALFELLGADVLIPMYRTPEEALRGRSVAALGAGQSLRTL